MKNEKIYRIVSNISFIIHSCVFVFVIIVSFLPYNEGKNFYQVFSGFFGEVLSPVQPIFMLIVLFSGCVFSFFAIKKPLLSIIAAVLTFLFFFAEALPIVVEAILVSLFSRLSGETDISAYQIGYKLMNTASFIIYFDFAFVLYSIITLIYRKERPVF